MFDNNKTCRFFCVSMGRLLPVTAAVLAVTAAAAQNSPYAPPPVQGGTPAVHLAQSGDESRGPAGGISAVQLPGGAAPAEDTPHPAGRARRLTLEQVKSANPPVASLPARMAQLSVEAAKQHRLAVQADYFPKFGALAGNLHYTDFLGSLVTVRRPLLGTQSQVTVPIFSQNQTFAVLTFTQPLTPLLQVHQAVKIARADERIAMAKAASPIAKNARKSKLEETYFKLLIAQRKLLSAESKVQRVQGRTLYAGASLGLVRASDPEPDVAEAQKTVVTETAEVRELTASLNRAMGWPEDTELELATPDPLVENVSLGEISDKSVATSPDVIVAEQTVVKARAASTLSKLAYVPSIAAVSGYMFQNIIPAVPSNYGYGGVIASYDLFDFGKREHTIKEAHVQLEMAELALQATKAKVAADLKKSYFELERSRQLSQVAQKMGASLALVLHVTANGENAEVKAARADAEVEMLEADLAHRQAYARLKALMGP